MPSRTAEVAEDAALMTAARSLLSASAVRDRAQRLLALALDGREQHWSVDLDRLPAAAEFVASVVRDRYPLLNPPPHARWRHFQFEGRDLWRDTAAAARWPGSAAATRAAFDLVITSVLLDAGAGAAWRYRDPLSGLIAGRSEGLALASLRWFTSGGLSDVTDDPLRVDATVLRRIDTRAVSQALQVSDTNPLQGTAGRAALLNRLGATVQARPDLFGLADSPRPGGLFDAIARRASAGRVPATVILETLLDAFGPIWQDRPRLAGVPLGDCWPHPALGGNTTADRYVPLHKLSQWLAYSLIEPLEHAGITVFEVGELTGLAEYRNGGLFVDMGVLVPRDPATWSATHAVPDPFVVGWRAMTVALLDRIAPLVREQLGLNAEALPLARVLEGGTWAAGRLIARQRRPDGGPPFHILSDGTVF